MPLTLPTPADVRAIIATSLDDGQLQAVINDAALIAEACPAVAGYPAARQASIVKYITAHLLAGSAGSSTGSGAITQKALGDASESYAAGQLGMDLKSSAWGQKALLLDPSGCLATLGRQSAYFKVL